MIFKAEAIYSQNDFIGFMKVYEGRSKTLASMGKVMKTVVKAVGFILIGAACSNLYTMIYGTIHEIVKVKPFGFILQFIMILLGIFLLFFYKADQRSGKKMWKKYEGQGASIGYCFYDDHYSETRQGNEKVHKYKGITAVYEDSERFYLFVSEASAHMVLKNSFEIGTPEDFAEFIAKKTHLEVQHV